MLAAAMTVVVMMAAVAVAVMMVVGAALGIKRCFDRLKPSSKAAQHIFDHVIAPDAQPLAHDLDVDVTIADMPGKARQIVGVGGGDFDQRLGPADDPNDCAVFQHEAIPIPQRHRLWKIEQKLGAALAAQQHPPAMALMRIERDRVDGACLIPMSGSFNFARALHG